MMNLADVHPSRLEVPCKECGKQFSENEERVMSFYRGEFIFLHENCTDFIQRGGPRQ